MSSDLVRFLAELKREVRLEKLSGVEEPVNFATSLVEAVGVLDSCSLDRNRLASSLSLSVAEVKTGLSRIVGTFTVGEARVDKCSL